jgi:hypothetical protein
MDEWIDRSVLEAASWRLASELVRRHPVTTRMIHTHPGGGLYDCLTITSPTGDGGTVHLNRNGTIQVHARFDGRADERWEPTDWDDYLRADPRDFLDRLERACGLPSPAHVPSSTPATLTYRLLAALATTAVKSVHPIEIHSGQLDTSGHGSGPNVALDSFSGIPEERRRAQDNDLFRQAGYRFWIVLREHVPILAFLTRKWAWRGPSTTARASTSWISTSGPATMCSSSPSSCCVWLTMSDLDHGLTDCEED